MEEVHRYPPCSLAQVLSLEALATAASASTVLKTSPGCNSTTLLLLPALRRCCHWRPVHCSQSPHHNEDASPGCNPDTLLLLPALRRCCHWRPYRSQPAPRPHCRPSHPPAPSWSPWTSLAALGLPPATGRHWHPVPCRPCRPCPCQQGPPSATTAWARWLQPAGMCLLRGLVRPGLLTAACRCVSLWSGAWQEYWVQCSLQVFVS